MRDAGSAARLDGNAAAALLAEAFDAEMTLVAVACPACGSRWWAAECHAYLEAPGTVLRCRACETLLVAVVRRGDTMCVDVRCSLG